MNLPPDLPFYEAVARRRMVRNYTDDPVDAEAVDRIIAAGRRAPSAGFTQGQSFVVVTDATTRNRIAELAGEAHYVAKGFDPWISRAPVHIVICTSEAAYRARYAEPDKAPDGAEHHWPVPYWWIDAGASLMAVLLAAVAEGLAAGFLGSHSLPRLAAELEIPSDVSPIGVVTLGHPAPDRPSRSLQRGWKATSEVVSYNRWGESSR